MANLKLNCLRQDGTCSVLNLSIEKLLEEYPEIGSDSHLLDIEQDFKPSGIVAAGRIILFKIDHIRCLITSTKVMFPQSCGSDIVAFVQAHHQDFPFEFQVLDGICKFMVTYFDKKINQLIRDAKLHSYIVDPHRSHIGYAQRVRLAQFGNQIVQLKYKVTDIFDLFRNLTTRSNERKYRFYLSDHEDGSAMETDTVSSVSTIAHDTEIFDRIINTYKGHFEENVDQIQQQNDTIQVVNNLQNTHLTIHRNKLAESDLDLTRLSVVISIANLISSAFGMNLLSGWEQVTGVFWAVFGVMIALTIGLYYLGWNRFEKI